MANREKHRDYERTVAVPSQEDEADIINEVGAELGEDGELEAPIENVRKLGAIDAETARQNRHTEDVAKRKVKGEKVSFSTNDPLKKYEGILKTWPTATTHVTVKRLSGGPEVTEVITSNPRSAIELFEAIKGIHGQCGEATYAIEFFDAGDHTWRGKGKITVKDTRASFQQGQPMMPPYQQGYPPPGYPPPGYQHPQYAPPQPPNGHAQQPPQPQPPPQVFVQPSPGLDMAAMFENFKQMFDMFQNVQQRFAPPPQAAAPQYPQPQPQLTMPPPPSPTASPAEQMAWMREIFQMFQKMQSAVMGQQAPAPQPQQPAHQPQVSAPMGPTSPPPRGYQWVWRPDFGAHVLMPEASIAPPSGPMYRGPRSPYYPQEGGEERPHMQQAQPQRQQSPADQVRDALGVVRQTMHAVREMGSVLGQDQQQVEAPMPIEQDDDSPVRIVEGSGSGKLVYDNKDGSLRPWDSILANLPSMMKWAGEQREAIQKGAEARQRREQGRSQEYVAVPVEDQRLPPPPASVPIQSEEPVEEESPWGAPTTPENRN